MQVDSELIVTLAKQALNNLPYVQHYCDTNDEAKFRREFGTVKIAMPRQSGHSTAALQLMYEYPDSLLFVPSGGTKHHIRCLRNEYIIDPDVHRRIEQNTMVPSDQAFARIQQAWSRPFVIVDQASMMRKECMDHIVGSLQASIILELG